MYTFLVISERRLEVDAELAWSFLGELYAEDQFAFPNLVPWLRDRLRH
jgi:hypothetical protein